jgi:hypothetical protein
MFAIGQGLMVLLLSYVTPEPGFWANWHWFMWWFSAIGCGLGGVLFVLAVGERLRAGEHGS